MKNLKEELKLKLLTNEKILGVQRKHWLALVFSLSVHSLIILCSVIVMLFFIHQQYPFIFLAVTIGLSLCVVSFLAIHGTFLVMDWYFCFYIITNQRIVHEHFFKVSGDYYEEVFLAENIESAKRVEKNIIYDYFGVEDVYVHFPTYDRTEPFIFDSPNNASEIEALIEEFSLHAQKGMILT